MELESTYALFLSGVQICKYLSCQEPTSLGSVNRTIFFYPQLETFYYSLLFLIRKLNENVC